MEYCGDLQCSVCGKLAQYAVLTPCCSRLACRVCAITNIVKFQGRCGLDSCHEATVLIPDLVPNQQVRRKVEEKEVWNEVVTSLPYIEPNIAKRTLDHTSEPNKTESKRMKVDKSSDHLGLDLTEEINREQKQSVFKIEARNALLTAITNAQQNKTMKNIGTETNSADSEVIQSIRLKGAGSEINRKIHCSQVTQNKSAQLSHCEKAVDDPNLLGKLTIGESSSKTDFEKPTVAEKLFIASSSGGKALPDTVEKLIPKEKSETLSDENGNIFPEKYSDVNRIQSVNATPKWRVIFMDCEQIFDGDYSQFTQIGCYVYRVRNRRKSTLFLSMYPTKNEEYLLMKQKSDLLKTLHLVWGKETGFQFVQPDGATVKAFSESDGLEDFLSFLTEEEDNVLFLSNAKCILPLLLNKINPNRLQKYVTGICELKTFLTESLGPKNHLTDISHTDDIYQRVMGKTFEEITPTCAQTAKYMFQLVEKIHTQQGNRHLDFKSFISKYFKPTSHFISKYLKATSHLEKFANLGTNRNESTSGNKILVEIESSFRVGFLASVEMCKVDLIDLTGLPEKTSQRLTRSKNTQPKLSLIKLEPKLSLPKFEPQLSLPKFEHKLSFTKSEPQLSLPLRFSARRGTSSVKEDDSRRNLCEQSRSKNRRVHSCPSMSLCPLCGSLCADAVVLPCCIVSTCEACAWQMLFWGNFTCSLCKRNHVTPDHLIPDFSLRKDVWDIIDRQRGGC